MIDFNPSQLLPPLPDQTDVISAEVKINGTVIPSNLELMSVVVKRCYNRIPYALLELLDSDVSEQQMFVSDQDLFSPGNEVEIFLGYNNTSDLVFRGIILRHALKIKGGQSAVVEIECKDQAVRMTVERKNKYFLDDTDQGTMESIIREHGLEPAVDDTQVNYPEMVQYHTTDWDFILTRAEANAHLVSVVDGTVNSARPEFEGDTKVVLNYGTSIFEFEAEMDARDQYPAAKAVAWDSANQELLQVQADDNGVSALGGGLLGGLGAAAGAVSAAAGALGLSLPGVPPNTDYRDTLGVAHQLLQHSGKLSQPELENWASAQYQKSQLAKLKGRVKFEGVPDLYPGDRIELQNVGLRHSGPVLVTAIRHEMRDGSWFTEAQFGQPQDWFVEEFPNVCAPAAGGLLPAIQGLHIGVVTRLAGDPDQQDRVQVRLPIIAPDGEGIWVRVAAMDAGNDRGAFFRPEVEDEVVVGFIDNDPRQGIMLGMLHSGSKPAPLPTTDDNHEKGWVTRSGMRMIFNDDLPSFTLETPAGNKLVIDDDGQSILLEDQHGNLIKMDSDGICISSASDIKLEATGDVNISGVNIDNAAQAEFAAQGASMATLQSDAQTVVKGGTVMIN